MVRKLYAWLTLADYESAKEQATEQVVTRFARGNAMLQNGWYLDDEDLRNLSAAGDRALEGVRRHVPG